MDIVKKTLKVYILSILLFLVMTFLFAAVINFTGFREEWAFGGLIAILSLVTLALGYLEGRVIGKRGLITGAVAALVFLLLILFSVEGAFEGAFGIQNLDILYTVPIISGAVGGILGANRN